MGGFCQFWFFRLMLFCCFSVGLKKYEPLLCPRSFIANRSSTPADFGASVFFLTPSLLYRKWAGHRRFPCSRITQPVCSRLISRSHPVRDIGSQCTRSLCKPAGCLVRFDFTDCLPRKAAAVASPSVLLMA